MRNMNVRSGMSRRGFMGAVGAGAAGLAGAAMFGSGVTFAQSSSVTSPTLQSTLSRGKVLVGIGQVSILGVPPHDVPYYYDVKKDGDLLPDGFRYAGLDLDMGHCLSSAIFGDRNKVQFVQASSWSLRNQELQDGLYDATYNEMTRKISRDVNWDVFQGPVYHYGTYEYLLRNGVNPTTAVWGSTTTVGDDVAKAIGGPNVTIRPYASDVEVAQAYLAGTISAVGNSASTIVAVVMLLNMSNPNYTIRTCTQLGLDPIVAGVRSNDSVWQEIVSYVIYGLINADAWGWTSQNISNIYSRPQNLSETQQRWLGLTTAGTGPEDNVNFKARWGVLNNSWLYYVIKQNGNYREIYERHVGPRSAGSANMSVQMGGALDTVHL